MDFEIRELGTTSSRPPLSSLRTQGPIATGVLGQAQAEQQAACTHLISRGMGPGSARRQRCRAVGAWTGRQRKFCYDRVTVRSLVRARAVVEHMERFFELRRDRDVELLAG